MSPIAIRALLRRRRHQLALISAILALSAAIAVHHSGMSMAHADPGMEMGGVVEMCLGVFVAIGTAIVSVALGVIALGRWRPAVVVGRVLPAVAGVPSPRGRDGPRLLVVLCVCRR